MPQRSNEFQRLVYLVRTHLADPGVTVTESKLMADRRTGGVLEVDVCIEAHVAGADVVVSIECRDHRRKADVEWIHQMRGKHEGLATNVLLLASSRGFSRKAVKTAEAYGIKTFSLEALDGVDFDGMFNNASALWAKTANFEIRKVVIEVPAVGDLAAERVRLEPDHQLYLEDGSCLCSASEYANAWVNHPQVVQRFMRDAQAEHRWFNLGWSETEFESKRRVYVQKLEPLLLRVVDAIHIEGECVFQVGKLGLQRGRLGGPEVAWGRTKLGAKTAFFVATRVGQEAPKGSLTFSDDAVATEETHASSLKRTAQA